ncbi:MAG: redox-regulated ATPase YchF [Bacteroidia bacterium]|nr:redox-regulated ATPase YchF [Bacteroidia bacterium]MDW8133624.1 redox-regulated ATPase YchF [Bacteroidia bacterium]
MGLACGIVGLPNVGKSTLFNALAGTALAAAANYPFCTIEPNQAIVPVPDPRLHELATILPTEKVTPTALRIVDIAGLVKGAHAGEGLGNQFLSHIREVEAILHVLRCFESPEILHVEGSPNALRDKEIVDTELQLKDLETLDKVLPRLQREAKLGGSIEAQKRLEVVEKARAYLSSMTSLRNLPLSEEERAFLGTFHLLTLKPVLYIANVDEASLPRGNSMTEAVRRMAEAENMPFIMLCATLEAQLVLLPEEERAAFMSLYGIEEPVLPQLIRHAYQLLGLITFFTVGPKEIRAWTLRKGTTAQQAAAKIHTDMARGFIRAEVISYWDFIECRGEEGAKAAGKLRLEGKDYVVQDGDIIYIRFAV